MIEQVKAMAKNCGLYLVEFQSPVSVGIYRQPCGEPSYRLVDDTGKIKTYGTIETIKAYLQMNFRF
jgi:hypothetical protein